MIDEYLEEIIYHPDVAGELMDEVDTLYDELCCENKKEWENRLDEVDSLIANTRISPY